MGRGRFLSPSVHNIIISKHLESKSTRINAQEITLPKSVVHDIVTKYKLQEVQWLQRHLDALESQPREMTKHCITSSKIIAMLQHWKSHKHGLKLPMSMFLQKLVVQEFTSLDIPINVQKKNLS